MGSGLILFVIVGAWLAVLVPMGLRSHDSSVTTRSAERFEDAMRVLARRTRPAEPGPSVPLQTLMDSGSATTTAAAAAAAEPVPRVPERLEVPDARTPVSPETRRLRVLLALLGLTVVCLGVGLVGPPLLVLAGGVFALLTVLFVLHCRRQAVLRAEALRRRAARRSVRPAPVEAEAPPAVAPVRVPPRRYVPRPWPMEPAVARDVLFRDPLVPDLVAPLLPEDETVRQPARVAALGAEWQPVPVPLPTYVGKALAPVRRTQVLDLNNQGEWTPAVEAVPAADDVELDGVLDRRRAVGGW